MRDLTNPAPTMTSREIAELTGKEHRNVMADIRKMLAELHGDDRVLSFQQTVDRPNPSGGAPIPSPMYLLPKRETLILVSGYSVLMRARIIDRWQELEAAAAAPALAVPQTLPEALRLAADLAEKKAQAEAALAIAAPKAKALDRIATETEGAVCLRVAAKLVQVQEKKFISFLNSEGWIFRHHHSHTWQGYSDKEKAGLLELKRTSVTRDDGSSKTVEQVLVTPRGQAKAAELIERKAPWLRKGPDQLPLAGI